MTDQNLGLKALFDLSKSIDEFAIACQHNPFIHQLLHTVTKELGEIPQELGAVPRETGFIPLIIADDKPFPLKKENTKKLLESYPEELPTEIRLKRPVSFDWKQKMNAIQRKAIKHG
ncbi:hypothetical protein [Emticicia fontis]